MADPEASARIFISYRRDDSSGHVLALLPALRKQFGNRIFKDTDNVPPGEDFIKFIKRELQSCSVLLAIIGKDWLTAQDPRLKTRRLDNPDDFLRVELATALRSERIRVIPVLIERATMPAAMDLPADIAGLAQRNALELSDVRWESDVQLLIQAIQRACAAAAPAEAPGQWPELQDVQKRRAREIAGHLSNARQAFVARDYEATLLACEKALLLDPQNVEALDLLDLARTTTDEQRIETWLTQARQALDRGDIANASDLIDQALAMDPNLEAALALRKRVLTLRRERERGRERARVAAGAVERARTRLNEQNFESAVRHADDALSLEPQSTDAQQIRSKASASLDARRRPREPRTASTGESPALARPGIWSFRRYGGVAAAAAVILAAAIGFWMSWQASRSTPSAQSSTAPANAPSSPPPTSVTQTSPTPPPQVSSVPVEKPAAATPPSASTDIDPREQKLAGLRQEARDQFQRGQRTALSTVSAGLRIAPDDSDLLSILDSILGDARRLTGRAKEAAALAGAAQLARDVHQEALKLERDAAQQLTTGRKEQAIRTLWRAEEAFDRAERDARLERAQLKQLQDQQAAKQPVARANEKPGNQPAGNKPAESTAAAPNPSTSKPPASGQPRTPEPAAASPESQPTASDLEKMRVAGIVHRYASGYSALNPTAVSAVYPGEAVWQFSEFDSYSMKLDDLAIELSPDGSSATVVCTATHAFKRKRAAAPVTERLRQTFSLRRRGAGWIIVSIGYDRSGR
jgi:tetratricopeptide (TPR) repeat protein